MFTAPVIAGAFAVGGSPLFHRAQAPPDYLPRLREKRDVTFCCLAVASKEASRLCPAPAPRRGAYAKSQNFGLIACNLAKNKSLRNAVFTHNPSLGRGKREAGCYLRNIPARLAKAFAVERGKPWRVAWRSRAYHDQALARSATSIDCMIWSEIS